MIDCAFCDTDALLFTPDFLIKHVRDLSQLDYVAPMIDGYSRVDAWRAPGLG